MRILLVTLVCLFSFSVWAAESDPLAELAAQADVNVAEQAKASSKVFYTANNPPPKPNALKDVEKAGVQLMYMGETNGLYGWVGVRQGQAEYYYSSTNGKSVLMGVLFDGSTGALITSQQLDAVRLVNPDKFNQLLAMTNTKVNGPMSAATNAVRPEQTQPVQETSAPAAVTASVPAAVPTPVVTNTETATSAAPVINSESPAEKLIGLMRSASGFTVGDESAPVIYAFMDPDCPHCKKFLNAVAADIKAKKFSIRVVPVGRNAQATQRVAYLLASPNGGDQLLKAAAGDQTVFANMPQGMSTSAIEQNMQMLLRFKFDMTPSFVYRGRDGTVKIVRGSPTDLPAFTNDIGQ